MGLARYNQMRDFKMTPEPRGEAAKRGKGKSSFVIQKHDARRLHYDFRLEYDGVLMSWAVPKGPSLDPKDKRLAVRTEDHPLSYATFEGDIPHGHYGAGHVIVWDNGTWDPPEDVPALLREGHLDFELQGQKLRGRWSLIRLRNRGGERRDNWLLFKRPDRYAREDYDIVEERPESVLRKKRPPWKGAPLPEFVKPQLALLVDEVPEGEEWIHEIKFDGYRTLARLEDGGVRMLTRSGLDWTKKYGPLARELKALRIENALMDGEVIWTDARGRADFQGLQNALSSGNLNRLTYYVFDLLHLNGADLTGLPLKERKAKLKKLLARNKTRVQRVLYSEHWAHQGKAMLKQSCKIGLEGVVSKEAYQPYVPGRSPLWQKTKCSLRQEFVIGGYAASKSGGRSFGALLLGVYEEGGLRYAGRVGTGFSAETMRDLKARFDDLESGESPFTVNSPRGRDIHWLEPKLAGEVEFKAWTGDGLVRHASFQGLRADKAPKSVHQERIVSSKTAETKLKITHPDRVIYSKSKTLKADVLKYYAEVADLMFPFLENRPASILRCQNTSTKACFFQKHGLAGFQDR
ncbi:MAG TPA: DNA ligase D, partial [Bdellovibrionales bacterium]|nr:DNA ligase D [Bdellovibrionales bacterium]